MNLNLEAIRVLLVSPLPPPMGGIATWTEILLREVGNYPKIHLAHIDAAVRWKSKVNRSRLLQLTGGSLQAIRDIFRVFYCIVVFKPDVLHLTTSGGYASLKDLILMSLARMFGVSGLIHYRTSRIAGYRVTGKWVLRIALLAMRMASLVVVLDQNTYSFLEKFLPSKKLKTIPNMVDLNEIDKMTVETESTPKPENKLEKARLVFVGLICPEKGIVELVEACTQLARVHLHLVGPVAGSFCDQLRTMACHRDNGKWLFFHGHVDSHEARRQILLGDIFLLPSHKEAFPNALLEGMAFGKPVIVTDVGAMPEIIDAYGKHPCGVCVKPEDTKSLLVGLEEMLEDPEKWEIFGERARLRVERLYSSGPVMEQLQALWYEMTSTKDELPKPSI